MIKRPLRFLLCVLYTSLYLNIPGNHLYAQSTSTVMFYNVENLFDTLPDPTILDKERTPAGLYRWNEKRYTQKINRIAELILQIENKYKEAPSLIGLCEVENASVLQDLTRTKALKPFDYQWIHHNSPDRRGIDVALLYRKEDFLPLHYNAHRLLLKDKNGYRIHTRDQLVISGLLGDEELSLLIVHWPSRRGGKRRSAPLRLEASKLSRKIIDSLQKDQAQKKILVLGDFNDNPTDESLLALMNSKQAQDSLFNPMLGLYHQGYGTVAYRDEWTLFDQVLINEPLKNSPVGWIAKFAEIFSPAFLFNQRGRYAGYPYRTYAGTSYQGGFSDHLPVLLRLQRRQ